MIMIVLALIQLQLCINRKTMLNSQKSLGSSFLSTPKSIINEHFARIWYYYCLKGEGDR